MPNFLTKRVRLGAGEADGVRFLGHTAAQNGCVLVLAEVAGGALTPPCGGDLPGRPESALTPPRGGDLLGRPESSGALRTLLQINAKNGAKFDYGDGVDDDEFDGDVDGEFGDADGDCAGDSGETGGHFVCKIDKTAKLSDLFLMQKILGAFNKLFCSGEISRAYASKETQKDGNNIIAVDEFIALLSAKSTTTDSASAAKSAAADAAAKSAEAIAKLSRADFPGCEQKASEDRTCEFIERAFCETPGKSAARASERATAKFLEIGFGSGRHLLARAAAEPGALFFGAEIHRPSLLQTSRLAAAQNLENIRLLDADARILLAAAPDDCLDGIYVHFPVPWPDAPARRVISAEFAAQAARALRPGGFLQLRTDEEFYFRAALEIFASWRCECSQNEASVCLSKYETRWQKQGKNIYELNAFLPANLPASRAFEREDFGELVCENLRTGFLKRGEIFAKVARIYDFVDFSGFGDVDGDCDDVGDGGDCGDFGGAVGDCGDVDDCDDGGFSGVVGGFAGVVGDGGAVGDFDDCATLSGRPANLSRPGGLNQQHPAGAKIFLAHFGHVDAPTSAYFITRATTAATTAPAAHPRAVRLPPATAAHTPSAHTPATQTTASFLLARPIPSGANLAGYALLKELLCARPR